MRVTVRGFGSNIIHRADVDRTVAAMAFGQPYRATPANTVTLCGTHIRDGVVLADSHKVKCRYCKLIEERYDPCPEAQTESSSSATPERERVALPRDASLL